MLVAAAGERVEERRMLKLANTGDDRPGQASRMALKVSSAGAARGVSRRRRWTGWMEEGQVETS